MDSIHITGSDKTYDAVVWQGQPKVGTPPLTKHVTAELGCVSPVVIAPGQWSDADLRNKALEICKNVATNASCNCIANKARGAGGGASAKQPDFRFLSARSCHIAASSSRNDAHPLGPRLWSPPAAGYHHLCGLASA